MIGTRQQLLLRRTSQILCISVDPENGAETLQTFDGYIREIVPQEKIHIILIKC